MKYLKRSILAVAAITLIALSTQLSGASAAADGVPDKSGKYVFTVGWAKSGDIYHASTVTVKTKNTSCKVQSVSADFVTSSPTGALAGGVKDRVRSGGVKARFKGQIWANGGVKPRVNAKAFACGAYHYASIPYGK